MKNPKMVMEAIKTACNAHPHERVMQVIVNACGPDPFYLEDETAASLLCKYAKNQGGE